MIKEKLGHRIDGWIHALFPFLFWRPINPDVLTVVGTRVAERDLKGCPTTPSPAVRFAHARQALKGG